MVCQKFQKTCPSASLGWVKSHVLCNTVKVRYIHVSGKFSGQLYPPNEENLLLVTDKLVEVQEWRKITGHYRGIYGIYLKLVQKPERSKHVTGWSWKHLDFDRHAQNLPGHCSMLDKVEFMIFLNPSKMFCWSSALERIHWRSAT